MRKTNGFTLIELLAVIVILAIIALIAVPMILGVVEKARKSAAESSALGYIDAVEKQMMINELATDKTKITSGVYDVPMASTYGVKVKGSAPTSGWLEIANNKVERYSFVIGKYVVSYDGTDKTTIKGDTANEKPSGSSPVVTIKKDICPYEENHEFTFDYTGSEQTFTVPCSGNYKVELWGAYGGSYGGYVSGKLKMNKDDNFYLYIGATNKNFNYGTQSYEAAGGATDIRTVSGNWNNAESLRSRIMVAGGGGAVGGLNSWNSGNPYGGSAGGLTAYNGGSMNNGSGGVGANQTSGYAFGVAGGSNAGGSGYYSGRSGYYGNGVAGSGGGSSFISGHTGCVAITSASNQSPKSGCTTGTTNNECSKHYSGLVFTDTKMIDGAGYSWTNVKGSLEQMSNPSGGYYTSGRGHTGNGYAKITYLGK